MTAHEEVHRTCEGLATVTLYDDSGTALAVAHAFTLSDARRAAHRQLERTTTTNPDSEDR